MIRKKISIRLPVLLWEKVAIAAKFLNLNKTSYVILALTDRLDKDIENMEKTGDLWKRS